MSMEICFILLLIFYVIMEVMEISVHVQKKISESKKNNEILEKLEQEEEPEKKIEHRSEYILNSPEEEQEKVEEKKVQSVI